MSRVACETASCTGFVLVTGEITTKAQLDIPSIVRKTATRSDTTTQKQVLTDIQCSDGSA